ncbi:MAG: FAD binding domain-containing protein [Rhizobiaceae bacterium]|nr:FAD binding domain-containing protein [Rhizobiaceae bacterium]
MPLSLRTFSTVREAEQALVSHAARYLGGGTLAMRAANEGDLSFNTLVRSSDPALSLIKVEGSEVRLGASITMAAIMRHPALGPIAGAARAVGGPAVRNMATIGGNLFAPTPYGDFTVALLALGASVEVEGRSLDLDEFLFVRERFGGIVSGVSFPLPPAGGFRFVKVSRVKPKGVSVLSIATLLETDGSGAVTRARVALGCMGGRPIRAKKAEDALMGAHLTEGGIARAVEAVSDGVNPPTDPVASAWYRREVLPVHFRRLLLQ